MVVLDPEAVDAEAEAYWDRAQDDHARSTGLALDPEEALIGLDALRTRLEAAPLCTCARWTPKPAAPMFPAARSGTTRVTSGRSPRTCAPPPTPASSSSATTAARTACAIS